MELFLQIHASCTFLDIVRLLVAQVKNLVVILKCDYLLLFYDQPTINPMYLPCALPESAPLLPITTTNLGQSHWCFSWTLLLLTALHACTVLPHFLILWYPVCYHMKALLQ